jgi:hypothetical protein
LYFNYLFFPLVGEIQFQQIPNAGWQVLFIDNVSSFNNQYYYGPLLSPKFPGRFNSRNNHPYVGVEIYF